MSSNEQAATVKAGLPGRHDDTQAVAVVSCQICNTATYPGLDLGHQPVSDLILTTAQLSQPETYYPMRTYHCPACGLSQLGYIVDPDVVFKDFPFVSGTTQTATHHLQSLPAALVQRRWLDAQSLAVDIGSNDGTLLKGYRPFGIPCLGVDPSGDPVRIANEQGIPTLHAFFNEVTAKHIICERGHANAITACGVFAHIADLASVMRGVKQLLAPSGVFATDSQYWLDMVQRLHYDNIFHQHLRNYSLKPLIYLHRQYDMDVFDVERSEVYGGSIRVFSCHRGDHPISERVRMLMEIEEQARLYEPATNEKFARDVAQKRDALFDRVYRLKSEGKKIIGLGAPAKASTVCNYVRLGPELVDYVTEINPLRMGKFLPGMHIPIVDEEWMFKDPKPADTGILFAWNYRDELMPKLRARGFAGGVLQP